MNLIRRQKNGEAKKKSQEQPQKVKTFSRSYDYAPANAYRADRPVVPMPLERETAVPPVPDDTGEWKSSGIPDSIELQDTLLTDDSFVERAPHPEAEPVPDNTSVAEPEDSFAPVSETEPDSAGSREYAPKPASVAESIPGHGYADEYETESGMEYEPEYGDEYEPEPEFEDEDDTETEPEEEYEPDFAYHPEPEDGEDDYEAPEDVLADDEDDTGFEYEPESDDEDDAEEPGSGFPAGPGFAYDPDREDETEQEDEPDDDTENASGEGSRTASLEALFPRLERTGRTTLSASWQSLPQADGYDVFFAPCGTEFGGVYRTLPAGETSCVFSRLEKKTVYKLRVKPFSLQGGQKEYIGETAVLRCITGGSRKYTNAAEILPREDKLDLLVGEKRKIGASVNGQEAEKQVLTRGGVLRYLSDDPSVASVSKEGKVKGLRAGTCRVYLIALTGVCAAVDITVLGSSESSGSVAFRKKKYSIKVGKKINLKKKLAVRPEEGTASLKWKSSDKDIAQVSKKGVVKARKKGRITVRVKSSDGAHAKVRIRVNAGGKQAQDPWKDIWTDKDSRAEK